MRFSTHFYESKEDAIKKRFRITEEMCIDVVEAPEYSTVQANGNVAHWGAVDLFGDGKMRYLCVVTTVSLDFVVTAYPDRDFPKKMRKMGVEQP